MLHDLARQDCSVHCAVWCAEATGGISVMNDDIAVLRELEKKVLWLASWTIHNANHLREHKHGLKVGAQQAPSASLATIMPALYFAVLRPQDRVAVKPH